MANGKLVRCPPEFPSLAEPEDFARDIGAVSIFYAPRIGQDLWLVGWFLWVIAEHFFIIPPNSFTKTVTLELVNTLIPLPDPILPRTINLPLSHMLRTDPLAPLRVECCDPYAFTQERVKKIDDFEQRPPP